MGGRDSRSQLKAIESKAKGKSAAFDPEPKMSGVPKKSNSLQYLELHET